MCKKLDKKYFGISIKNEMQNYFIENENILNYCNVPNKSDIIEIVNTKYYNANWDIYLSRNSLKIKDVKNFMHEQIFAFKYSSLNIEQNGWLVFCDMVKGANWGHACKYVFICDSSEIYEVNAILPPDKTIQIDKIN